MNRISLADLDKWSIDLSCTETRAGDADDFGIVLVSPDNEDFISLITTLKSLFEESVQTRMDGRSDDFELADLGSRLRKFAAFLLTLADRTDASRHHSAASERQSETQETKMTDYRAVLARFVRFSEDGDQWIFRDFLEAERLTDDERKDLSGLYEESCCDLWEAQKEWLEAQKEWLKEEAKRTAKTREDEIAANPGPQSKPDPRPWSEIASEAHKERRATIARVQELEESEDEAHKT